MRTRNWMPAFAGMSGVNVGRSGFRHDLERRALSTAVVRQHEIGNARLDFRAETRAVEHAIMADAGLKVMRLHVVRNAGAQFVRRLGLTNAGNVIVLALDGEQPDSLDLGEIDR